MIDPYETDDVLNQYLLFHYGTINEIFGKTAVGTTDATPFEFPVRTVADTFDLSEKPFGRALDLGCAVGRSAFELSNYCEEVVAIDYSQAFIDTANALKNRDSIEYERLEEASLTTTLSASAPENSNPDRITFIQGDAMNLPEDLGTFDLVHAANLLCRLSEPKKFLDRLPSLINPKGQLVLATPGTWLEEYTPRENWPPGTTKKFVADALAGSFDLVKERDLPFFLREHVRKFQFTTSQCSLWRRLGDEAAAP